MDDAAKEILDRAPTWMDMEDLVRRLDVADMDPWDRKTVNEMRRALNELRRLARDLDDAAMEARIRGSAEREGVR